MLQVRLQGKQIQLQPSRSNFRIHIADTACMRLTSQSAPKSSNKHRLLPRHALRLVSDQECKGVLALPQTRCHALADLPQPQPEVVMKEVEAWGRGGLVFQPSSTTYYFVATDELLNFI